MNLSAPFIQRPVMTVFLMLSIILAGGWAFFKLPVSDLPSVEKPLILISTAYEGASPEVVLEEVTIPLEKELSQVKGIKEMTSKSHSGHSSIALQFDLSKDMKEAILDVQTAIHRADHALPRDLTTRPSYHLQENSQEPIMWILLTSTQTSIAELRSYADSFIIPKLSRLEGVSEVPTLGNESSIWLRLNPERMAARGIGFNEVIQTVKTKTKQIPLGSIQTSNKQLFIEWKNEQIDWKDLKHLSIGETDVQIQDIGEFSDKGLKENNFRFLTSTQSSLAFVLGIKKVADGNTVAISNAVREVLSSVEKELPPNIHLNIWFDKAIWIKESLYDVEWTLIFAFLLVIGVIYLSLGRISESLITSTALPLSLLGTFIFMYFSGFSLNLLSLLALTLAVGFVVDDAIVVLENIVRHQEKGMPPKEASLMGSQQICFTIFSMTLSLVAVFIPLLFMPGMNGRLFREFSLTLAIAILVSGFISLSLTPMLCSRFLRHQHQQNALQKRIQQWNDWMLRYYAASLTFCFRFPKSVFFIALSSALATIYFFMQLSVTLVPPEDRGFLFTFVNMPSGISTDQFNQKQQELEKLLQQNASIDKFLSLNHNKTLVFLIHLHPLHKRPPLTQIKEQIQSTLDAIPGIQTFIRPYQLINLDMEFGNSGQYKFILQSQNRTLLQSGAKKLTEALHSSPLFPYVKNSLENDSRVLSLKINEELALKYGFNKEQIQNFLSKAYGKNSIGSIKKEAKEHPIFMELLPHYQNSIDTLEKLFLKNEKGELIPFQSLATWKEELGPSTIVRIDQLPSATIQFSLANSIDPKEGFREIETLAKKTLPDHVQGSLSGSAQIMNSTLHTTLLLLLAAAVVMYIVLGILYESFIHPLTILSSLPFAGLGGALTLFLFKEPVSIFSAVGFLLLIGIVKKNGIMMVDYAIESQKNGKSPKEAITEACLTRFRPIMMTTLAAIMGALPIAVGFGEGAEARQGLGLVIVGGLLFSQLLTLYGTPILFLLFKREHSLHLKKALLNQI